MQNFEVTDISLNPDLMGLSIGAKNVETNEKYVVTVNASMIGFARDAFGAVLGNIGLNSFLQATGASQPVPVPVDDIQGEGDLKEEDSKPDPEDAAE